MGLSASDILVYKHNENITCSICDNKRVLYNGEITALSPLTASLLGGVAKYVQPTPHWYVKETGQFLSEIYDETYPIEENI